tara:strand:+ start:86 stop:298 length:213 start_codon:yes stop_codon:yes gene_type:complete
MKWWDILKGRRAMGTVFTLGDKKFRLAPEHIQRYEQLIQEYKIKFRFKPKENQRMALRRVINEFNIQAGV